jgi:hypothetical protein
VLVLPKHETRVRFPSGALSGPLGQLTEGVCFFLREVPTASVIIKRDSAN